MFSLLANSFSNELFKISLFMGMIASFFSSFGCKYQEVHLRFHLKHISTLATFSGSQGIFWSSSLPLSQQFTLVEIYATLCYPQGTPGCPAYYQVTEAKFFLNP